MTYKGISMFKNIQMYFDIGEFKLSNKVFIILIFFAYILSIAVRYYYYSWAITIPEFLWNGTLMINNVDGYYYAAGAKEILENSHIIGDRNPYNSLLSILTAGIVKFFPFLSLDSVILWMPAFFSSLIVIPIMLIGKTLKNDLLGFFAALVASIAWSYYNRTMVGYYDTDMLIIVFLMFVFWGIIDFLVNKNKIIFFLLPVFVSLFEWYYLNSRTLLLSITLMVFIYIFLFDRKNENFMFLLFLLFIESKLPFYLNFIIGEIIAVFLYKNKQLTFNEKLIYLLVFIMFFITSLSYWDLIYNKILTYLKITKNDIDNLHFYTTYKTISEASAIPYELVAKRISSDKYLFVFSFLGYILMLIRYPVMIISIPLVMLGIMAHKLGLRFTIYAVPFFALGYSYFVLFLAKKILNLLNINKQIVFIVISSLFVTVSLYRSIQHVLVYKVPTTFLSKEVESLNKLSKMATREDYAFTWWDYGYPIRYYSGLKTIIDGGKHASGLMYAVSYAFTRSQKEAYQLASLAVDYTDKVEVMDELGKDTNTTNFIQDMMKKFGYKNPNDFLKNLDNIKTPKQKRDIFIYLPFRLMNIFPTVAIFGYQDLKSGENKMPLIVSTKIIKANNNVIMFSNGIKFFTNEGILQIGANKLPVNSFYIGFYKKNKYHIYNKNYYSDSNIVILWYRPLNKVLILDKKLLNSTFVKLFFFEQYDKKLFKPVIVNPFVKIYKLKKL